MAEEDTWGDPVQQQSTAPQDTSADKWGNTPGSDEPGGQILDTGDIAKSAAIGVPKGIIAGVGAAGDLRQLTSQGMDKAAEYFGIPQDKVDQFKQYFSSYAKTNPIMAPFAVGPTSGDIQKSVEGVTGEFYEPKTTLGKGAQTVTEFAANPLAYVGPGGLGLKVATSVAAGLGSEAAGQAAQNFGGEEYEPVARITGALAAGKIPLGTARRQIRQAIHNASSTDELFNAADHLYDSSRTSGVQIKPSALDDLARKIKGNLTGDGFHPDDQVAVFRAVNELGQRVNRLGYSGISEIQGIRKRLGNAAKSTDGPTRAAAYAAIEDINKYMAALPMKDVAIGQANASRAVQDWKEADRAYSSAMKSTLLEEALEKAMRRAARSGSGMNVENSMRQEIDSILRSPRRILGFTPNEVAYMKNIVSGDFKGNFMRALGKLAPSGIVSGTLGQHLAELIFHGSGLGKIGTPLAGYALKKFGDVRTAGKIEDLISDVRSRGSAGPRLKMPPTRMVPGYMAPFLGNDEE